MRIGIYLAIAAVLAGLVLAGCAAATPAPTTAPVKPAEPTKAPAAPAATTAPTKAPAATTAPTKAPAAPAPTTAPAAKVEFPIKGRQITIVVPYPAGGPVDVMARYLAPGMEKELGTPVVVVNKAGASGQIGLTEVVKSRPDGHTIAATMQAATSLTYLDAEMKAQYGRKDFQPVLRTVTHPGALVVATDHRFKSVKDVVDEAKAKPEGVKMATAGILSTGALAVYKWAELAGIKFAYVDMAGNAEIVPSLIGGHTDITLLNLAGVFPQIKGGQLRAIAIMDEKESPYAPGVKTIGAQGYPLQVELGVSTQGMAVPAGTPKEIVDRIAAAAKKAMDDPETQKKYTDMGYLPGYMTTAEYEKYWDETDKAFTPLISLARNR